MVLLLDMKNSEVVIVQALRFLQQEIQIFISSDIDTFLGSLFTSAYTKSPQDEVNLSQLERTHSIRANIEKLQHTLTSEHKGINSFSSADGTTKKVNNLIANISGDVSKMEKIVDDASLSTYDSSAKVSIIGAYRSCRESYLTVDAMINIYNQHGAEEFTRKSKEAMEKGTSYPEKFVKLKNLSIPKDVKLPKQDDIKKH